MKISGQYPKPPIQDKNLNNTKEKAKGDQNEVNLSNHSKDISGVDLKSKRIQEKLNSESDIDQKKVAELKAKIKKGEYKIDSEKLADRMLKDSINEDII